MSLATGGGSFPKSVMPFFSMHLCFQPGCRCLWENAHSRLRKHRIAAIGGVLPRERYK